MKTPLSVNIPFDGFYESIWSSEFDQIEENEAEYFESDRQAEDGIPKELRISAADYRDILYRHSDYSGMYRDAARTIASAWAELAGEHLGFELGLSFEEMTSPKFYNFETDRIFMSIPRATVAKLFRIARADKFQNLAAVLEDRHTSYDGFHSFYSNDVDSWLAKPLSTWDHNEIASLLVAALAGFDPNEDLALYYRATDCDGFHYEWSDNVDWPKVEAAIEEAREEKRAELLADDPDYIAPAPRCPFTIEMQF